MTIVLILLLPLLQTTPSALDGTLRSALKAERPAPVDDAAFLRRLSQDLVGGAPTEAELEAYAADADPQKREKAVERLLADARYGRFWAAYFREVWAGDPVKMRFTQLAHFPEGSEEPIVRNLETVLRNFLNKDRSWTDILQNLIPPRGLTEGDPWLAYTLSFLSAERFPEAFGEGIARHFLGIRLACARCHDHPYEPWSMPQYYGMAAYARRLKFRWYRAGEEAHVEQKQATESVWPLEALPAATPLFLLGTSGPDEREDALHALARSVSAHPQTARALANRVWGRLFRYGLVHPVDQFDHRHKPLAPEALELLAKHLKETKYSVKGLLRLLCLTEEYRAGDGKGGVRELSKLRAEKSPAALAGAAPLPFKVEPPGSWIRLQARSPVLARYQVPPKLPGSGPARLELRKGAPGDLVEVHARQVLGRRVLKEGALTQIGGMMHCDSEADAPYRILLLLGERGSGKDKYQWKLEGAADTVDDWAEEFKALLGP